MNSIVLIDELNKQSELNEVGSESYIEEIFISIYIIFKL